MKNLRYIILIFCAYGAIGQPVPQTKKVTEKFFPDSKLTITTPAFQKDKGFTDHAEMMAFLDAMVAAHPDFISYTAIGESQKGKSIPLVPLTHRAAG
ncbi:peptidase, partial [Candidatus Poribacteria bacterium]|nr:peptidase [Candidatus Poribacteria bacterium]